MQTMDTVKQTVTLSLPNRNLLATTPPILINYLDYRKYLKDYYDFRVKTDEGRRPYSYAVFSAAADIKSPNYLKLIVEGKRNLSLDMALKFAKALQFNKIDSDEFVLLVMYNQSSDAVTRNKNFIELNNMRVQKKIQRGELNAKTWEKMPTWLVWTLYSMVDQANVNFDPLELTQALGNRAAPEEIQESLRQLFNSGVLKRDEMSGEIKKSRELMSSAQDVPIDLVRKLQTDLIYLGLESLYKDNPVDREIGAATLSLTEEEFNQIKFEIRQLRKRVSKDIQAKRMNSKGERLYQLNLQFFPVTDKVETKTINN
jgi:uncharacterized protein (TIGR02147 family)